MTYSYELSQTHEKMQKANGDQHSQLLKMYFGSNLTVNKKPIFILGTNRMVVDNKPFKWISTDY